MMLWYDWREAASDGSFSVPIRRSRDSGACGNQSVKNMGVYQNWVLPRLLDMAMRNEALDRYRRRTIGDAHGLVLEIGVGSGLNLPLYGPVVACVVALDPSRELLGLAGKRVADASLPVSLVRASAEQVPFANSAFNASGAAILTLSA
jgi:ubiquinone/menaquinone biosynthesis C-methylase UbiE